MGKSKGGQVIGNTQFPWLFSNTIFLARHGSHAYGLNTELSDLDIRGIFIAPRNYYMGLEKIEHTKGKEEKEGRIEEWENFELRKFLFLAGNCNPNIIELLYLEDEDMLKLTSLGHKLLLNRDKFLNKKIRYAFGGMAKHHLDRIKEHRDYILNPPNPPPSRKDFGLPEYEDIDKRKLSQCLSEIDKEITSWNIDFGELPEYEKIMIIEQMKALTEKYVDSKLRTAGRLLNFGDELITILEKERNYRNLNTKYKQYLDWKKTRNPKRFALEEKIGYDPKDGSHLFRIIRSAKEALLNKRIQVKRIEDREELLYIKNGNEKFEVLVEKAQKELKELDKAVEVSELPTKPNFHVIRELCLEITDEFFHSGHVDIEKDMELANRATSRFQRFKERLRDLLK